MRYKTHYISQHKPLKVKTKTIKKPVFDKFNKELVYYEVEGTIWNDFKKETKPFSIYNFDENSKMLQFAKLVA